MTPYNDSLYDEAIGPRRQPAPDIFQERWGRGSQHSFTSEWLRVWRHRAAQVRAEFKRDLRRSTIEFAARLAALETTA
jgi:hypothetical protein